MIVFYLIYFYLNLNKVIKNESLDRERVDVFFLMKRVAIQYFRVIKFYFQIVGLFL